MSQTPHYVYRFSRERTDGAAAMKNLLGGKGEDKRFKRHLSCA